MWRVTADNGQCRCEGYRRGWFASLGFDFGGGVAVLGRGKATGCLVLGWCRGSGGEGQLLTCSQHPGDGGPDVEVQRLEQQVDSHPCVADDRDATVGYLVVLDPRVQ